MISKLFFGAGILFIIIATLLFVLNHAGVSANFINVSFAFLILGIIFYLREIHHEEK